MTALGLNLPRSAQADRAAENGDFWETALDVWGEKH